MKRYLVIAAFILVACGGVDNSNVGEVPESRMVEYTITASDLAVVDITYENKDGGTSQDAAETTPWTKTVRMHDGDFFYISAQNNQHDRTIRCAVTVDGHPVASGESSGPFVITSCEGTVGE